MNGNTVVDEFEQVTPAKVTDARFVVPIILAAFPLLGDLAATYVVNEL
ncbi:hypothetical protein PBCVCVR1_078L [Paramecium bursaria Chlorella virus CVR-1]|uniref:Uncharacterized protein n=1 Tax=Paramecium bursaria Chlorella virus CVA-1 TaxID=42683 RepID=M1HEX9_9PHYC|nr:hypothetical protein F8205_gp022 [Paramecium bursaria Chlorella virus CVA-1]AGE50377.1 hypothetical protein PBCVCVA1_072L [Paramecium bursaria Chlorella virus CVA-1]AGE52053.1 hypothetical protein PBCVCVR1_078L [Paramecium bursaria Chlorella virus CVR-1]